MWSGLNVSDILNNFCAPPQFMMGGWLCVGKYEFWMILRYTRNSWKNHLGTHNHTRIIFQSETIFNDPWQLFVKSCSPSINDPFWKTNCVLTPIVATNWVLTPNVDLYKSFDKDFWSWLREWYSERFFHWFLKNSHGTTKFCTNTFMKNHKRESIWRLKKISLLFQEMMHWSVHQIEGAWI